jgi:hypothetical protein
VPDLKNPFTGFFFYKDRFMSSAAQVTANQINAQSSTGPTTEAGKIKASQNAVRHGLCCGIALTRYELPEEAQTLLDALREDNQPVGTNEEVLVFKMANHLWQGERAAEQVVLEIDRKMKGIDNHRELALMLRYQTSADRAYHKALAELRKLQQERRLEENGSVSQKPQAPAPKPPKPQSKPVPVTSVATEFAAPLVAAPKNALPATAERAANAA